MRRATKIIAGIALLGAAAWLLSPAPREPIITLAPIPSHVDISPPSEDQIRIERAIAAAKDKENREFSAAVMLARGLKQSMKNPASFQLEQAIKMQDGSFCFMYRATNSFNAIVPGHAVFSTEGLATSDDRQKFARAWKRSCDGKTGRDLAGEIRRHL
jgi:hypothetical protein